MALRPELDTPEDLRLVEAVLRKDRKATAELVARYADPIYSYVRRRTASRPEAANDLVQEVFLAAWQGFRHFRGEATLQSWLLGIARHKVEDFYRRRLREIEWPEDEEQLFMATAAMPSYEEELDRTSLGERVRKTIATLSEAYGVALFWRYLEGRSVRDMAQLTGKTEKAVERLLARAREAFRRNWEHAGR